MRSIRRISGSFSTSCPITWAIHYADNPWWLDVLEWGPRSPHAAAFDIDWQTLPGHPRVAVLVPILGSSYGEALEGGEIELRYDAAEGSFSAWYYEHRLPIGPSRYGEILQKVVTEAGAVDTPTGRRLLELAARYRGPHNPPRHQAPAFKAELAAVAGGDDVIEPRAARLSAEVRRTRSGSRAASSARAPALPDGVLATGRQRDQLPPFFRHQLARRIAGRGRRCFSGHSRPRPPPDRRGAAAWPAARPHRRAARPASVLPPPATPDRCEPTAERRAAGSMSSSKRSSPTASASRALPASRAPPATNGST